MNYTLPEYTRSKFTVLSLDPGSVNMGIACTEWSKAGPRLLANAVMSNPIKGLVKDIRGSRERFMSEIDQWMTRFGCKAMVMERYQSRGIKGNTAEEVSIMIGCLLQEYKDLKVKLLTAATWKNEVRRKNPGWDLKETYKVCKTEPHQLDATLIGLYGIKLLFKTEMVYNVNKLMAGVEQCSLTKLINRKPRV